MVVVGEGGDGVAIAVVIASLQCLRRVWLLFSDMKVTLRLVDVDANV